jgi:tetratricopeptide (TPR) repeat protein
MKPNRTVGIVASLLLVALLAVSLLARQKVEGLRGKESTLEEVLYLPSGKALKRMSLGYSGLLADIYWTRAVQYFGARYHVHSTRYELLAPLLDITTDLDPHLIVAYETGSIFLSQRTPLGAGQPDQAVTLLEKGIRENPEYWRLYFTLGFVHYVDRKDYKAAQEAFEKGSKVPGAYVWMKIMAARMAEHGGDTATAIELWQRIFETNTDKDIRQNALMHLDSLHADADIEALERAVRLYFERTGAFPREWSDLIHLRILGGVPVDATGAPYKLLPDGTVQVQDPSKFKFLGEFRRNKQ